MRTFALIFLSACRVTSTGSEPDPDSDTSPVDVDGDGWPAGTDCDDADDAIHPDAAELCDGGLDNDCDGLEDGQDPDATTATWYADTDLDGYGDAGSTLLACEPHDGWVANATDCDDSAAATFPGAAEVCDGADNDCDGLVDDADPDVGGVETTYADTDGDGYGDPHAPVVCSAGVDNAHDCDDTDASRWACDGSPDDGTVCPDVWGVDLGVVPAWTGSCDETLGFDAFEDSCYWAARTEVTLADARASCAAAGGWLSAVQSTREDDFLVGLAGVRSNVWLGGCDGDEEGTWRWFTGEAWGHQRWHFDDPRAAESDDDCVAFADDESRYRWRDVDCGLTGRWVCEFGTVEAEVPRITAAADCAFATVSPVAEALDVDRTSAVTLSFSAPVDPTTVEGALFVTGAISGSLRGALTWSGAVATWVPDEGARAGERVTAVLTDEARCLDGARVSPTQWEWFAAADTGTAAFTKVTTSTWSDALGMAVADFDGDGVLEAAIAGDTEIRVFDGIETGGGTILGSATTDGRVIDLVAFDVDGDGDMDLAGAIESTDAVVTWLNDGAGGLTEDDRETFDDGPWSLAAADLDSDGDLDLAVSLIDAWGVLAWLRNDGAGDFVLRAEQRTDDPAMDLAAGDIDADGDLDLVGVSDRTLYTWLGEGTDVYPEGLDEYVTGDPYRAWLGDLDADGTLDGVFGSSDLVFAFGNDGTGDLDLLDDEAVDCRDAIAVGDLDADGDQDVVCVGESHVYDPELLTNNGSGNFRTHSNWPVGLGVYDATAADVDGDGAVDVVLSGQDLLVLLNTP